MLRVEHLKVANLPAISFEIADGECLAVEAPSGTGKTRLLRAIADLDPVSGHVFLDGAEKSEMSADLWRKRVRYVAAEPAWWTDTPRGCLQDGPLAATRMPRLLHALGIGAAKLDQPVASLSTGEKARLALARALVDEPKVLLLDEPTAALDPATAALVEELIKFQTLSGRSVILVSHDRGQIERLAHARLLLGKRRGPDSVRGARA